MINYVSSFENENKGVPTDRDRPWQRDVFVRRRKLGNPFSWRGCFLFFHSFILWDTAPMLFFVVVGTHAFFPL